MVIRQRAVLAEDKQERQQAILDAAERLLARWPDRLASVAEVAGEAGLAKGTVYLYFPSKEELLLAVHERQIDVFFGALGKRLAEATPVALDDMMGLTHAHMVERPTFLPLATRCFGIMATGVPRETADAFRGRMRRRLELAGAGLEQHFPELEAGAGLVLLRRSFALIVGLWQMTWAHADAERDAACGLPLAQYPEELRQALTALWEGTIGHALAPATERVSQVA